MVLHILTFTLYPSRYLTSILRHPCSAKRCLKSCRESCMS